MTYKTRFENIRNRYGISREKFAQMIGVDTQTVLEWENGIQKPDLMYLVAICEKFNVSLNELIRDIPVAQRKPINLIKPDDMETRYRSMPAQKVKYPENLSHRSDSYVNITPDNFLFHIDIQQVQQMAEIRKSDLKQRKIYQEHLKDKGMNQVLKMVGIIVIVIILLLYYLT